jgi:diguanylate cyclase (GGDEF)-like protein
VLGRIGGEEFAVVLPRSDIEAAYARAERIRVCFAASCRVVGGHHVDATVSCGLSVSLTGEAMLDALLEASDTALYRAKADGRNRVKRADPPKHSERKSSVIRVA